MLTYALQPLRWVVRGQALLDHFGGGGGDPRLHASVNWMSSSGDILFHFNPRPAWNPPLIFCDTRINGVWVGDQIIPLVGDVSLLEWTVLVDNAGFHVIDRGSEVLVRSHRAPWSSFAACQYTNGVTLLPVGNDGLPVPATTHNWALVRIRTHTHAYVRIRIRVCLFRPRLQHRARRIRNLHTTGRWYAYARIRTHTHAYVRIRIRMLRRPGS
jgi:hypothetical protein